MLGDISAMSYLDLLSNYLFVYLMLSKSFICFLNIVFDVHVVLVFILNITGTVTMEGKNSVNLLCSHVITLTSHEVAHSECEICTSYSRVYLKHL